MAGRDRPVSCALVGPTGTVYGVSTPQRVRASSSPPGSTAAPVPYTSAAAITDAVCGTGDGATTALRVDTYARQQRRFHHLLTRGAEPGAYVLIAHCVVDEAQVPSGPDRRDLSEQYRALVETLDAPEVLDALLGSDVDHNTLAAHGVVVDACDGDTTVARIVCEGGRDWPAVLGGGQRCGEIERWFTLTVRHAGWRDRQVRRLAHLTVESIELHPDPAHTTL